MKARADLRRALEELAKRPEMRERLKAAVILEESRVSEGKDPSWTPGEVGLIFEVPGLLYLGVVERVSKRPEKYRLSDRELTKKVLEMYGVEIPSPEEEEVKLPDDLFDVIVGYEDVKEIFIKSLKSKKPVHILMVGPPACAKSLFLMEIERLPGAVFITAGTSTRVGIRDIIFERLPRYLLIDELDKVKDAKDLSALLTWMESGRVVVAKHRKYQERRGKGWVFAAANDERKIPREIKSRFLVIRMKPYTEEEFIKVAKEVLVRREGVAPEVAEYIAEKVAKYTRDIRDAVKIARLAKTKEEVDKLLETLKKYGWEQG